MRLVPYSRVMKRSSPLTLPPPLPPAVDFQGRANTAKLTEVLLGSEDRVVEGVERSKDEILSGQQRILDKMEEGEGGGGPNPG